MLASWRGARLEVVQVLREVRKGHDIVPDYSSTYVSEQVVDKVLKEHGQPDAVLYNRAKVIIISIMVL